jgi:hypothetical protein
MIRLERASYVAYCDGECGAWVKTGLRSFHQAINYMTREADWQNRKSDGGGWRNYCPNCAELPNPEQENAGIYIGRRVIPEDD